MRSSAFTAASNSNPVIRGIFFESIHFKLNYNKGKADSNGKRIIKLLFLFCLGFVILLRINWVFKEKKKRKRGYHNVTQDKVKVARIVL